MQTTFSQFFSLDSPKAIKARSYGWMNAINYMAPHTLGGVGNLCPWSTKACRSLCLGPHSGRGVMSPVRNSRKAKARLFMRDRAAFMAQMQKGIDRAARAARKTALRLCIRLNGSTDIAWERVAPAVFSDHPHFQFVDYTKSYKRMIESLTSPTWPCNYRLCFSHSESNLDDCLRVLELGGTVAIVFRGPKPATWHGFPVVDGDLHDLRHLDPAGSVVALTPKGSRARRDRSGFVVDVR